MIRIKAAMKLAAELHEAAENLPKSTVNRWSRKGIVSKLADYQMENDTGGRSGLYPDRLPIEIALTAHLKQAYKLSQIKQARELFINKLNAGLNIDAAIEELENDKAKAINKLKNKDPNALNKFFDYQEEKAEIENIELAIMYAKMYNYLNKKLKGGEE